MKAVIFDGSRGREGEVKDDTTVGDTLNKIEAALAGQLSRRGWDVERIELRSKNIAGCVGCFGCWVKTPGECVIDDYGREVARKAVQSDLLVLLTPVTFGGYSSELKKALDRIICTILPYFEMYHGNIHHKMRYGKYPKCLFIGVLPLGGEGGEKTFLALAERNALNMRPPAHASEVFKGDEGGEGIAVHISELLKRVEVVS